MDFKKLAKDNENQMIEWRRDLHKIPEAQHDLPKTSRYVCNVLDELKIEYKSGIAGSGIVATIYNGIPEGKTFAIRTDMDALDINEETGLPFSSEHKGKMHACGHDAHMAIALGAAKILNEKKESLNGNVKFIFQPAEEGPGGAKPMIEENVLKDPDVGAIIGLHIGAIFKEVKPGQIGIRKGSVMACLDRFSLEIIGQGGHGAMPHTTVDPIAISASVIQDIQTLISREISPVRPAVISVCKIEGGTAYNVIPGNVKMEGTARFIHEEERQSISRRLGELVEQAAKSRRAEVNFDYHYGYPPVVNPPEFTDFFHQCAKELMDPQDIIELEEPVMGGEDMAYFLLEVPGTFFFLGGAREHNGKVHPHHHSKFDVDENVFWLGTALFIKTAFEWLKQN